MTWKNLGNPYPRSEPKPYRPLQWQEGQEILLGPDLEQMASGTDGSAEYAENFHDLVAARRTRYELGSVSLRTLGSLFALTSRVSVRHGEHLGFPLSQRPAPSAGAVHPIHIVIHLPDSPALHRYDPFTHSLRELDHAVDVEELCAGMNAVVPGGNGTLLLFVAEPARTFTKYAEASSLIWRDAGILQGYFSIASEALALNFVPLGVTGEPWANHLVKEPGLAGVGAAFVGARSRGGLKPSG